MIQNNTPQGAAIDIYASFFNEVKYAIDNSQVISNVAKSCSLLCVEKMKNNFLPIGARNGSERTLEIWLDDVIENIKKF